MKPIDATGSPRRLVYAALFAALTAVGAYLSIPVGPVPIVLQNLFVMLAGLLLGRRGGVASVGLYLLAGACGLPVFAGGSGGLARFFGPTGGYLIGYLPAVWVIGLIAETSRPRALRDGLALIAGCMVLYACGLAWLKVLTGMDWPKTLAIGMLPFLPGDALKIAAAVALTKALRPLLPLPASLPSPARPEGSS
ncbi:MAG TPA: biotin transporter BioY [Desulfobacterales bacterium]